MLRDSLGKENEGDKKVRYAILKVFGIVALGVAAIGALGAGVGLALGAFGISTGIPLVGSALVTAGSWLATAIPALGVALPIALGTIGGFGIAALAIFGIYKFVKSLSISPQPGLMPGSTNEDKLIYDDNISNRAQKNGQTPTQTNDLFTELGEDGINSSSKGMKIEGGNQPSIPPMSNLSKPGQGTLQTGSGFGPASEQQVENAENPKMTVTEGVKTDNIEQIGEK